MQDGFSDELDEPHPRSRNLRNLVRLLTRKRWGYMLRMSAVDAEKYEQLEDVCSIDLLFYFSFRYR